MKRRLTQIKTETKTKPKITTQTKPKITTKKLISPIKEKLLSSHISSSNSSSINKKFYEPIDNNLLLQLLSEHLIYLYKYNPKKIHKNDYIYTERHHQYMLIKNHIQHIINNITINNDEDINIIINKLNNCFINDDDNDNIIKKDNYKLIFTSNNLGTGSWGIVNKLEGTTNDIIQYTIACKLMQHYKFNINEILYFLMFSKFYFETGVPHFPIMYSYFYCNNLNDTLPNFIKTAKLPYFILLTELCNGTLKNKILNIISDYDITIIFNAISQLIIGYSFLHSIGHIHKDCNNPANFLFKVVDNIDSYFNYKIITKNSIKNIYIKNLGYLWIINDFGVSLPIQNDIIDDTYLRLEEYRNFINGILFFFNTKSYSSSIYNRINSFLQEILTIIDNYKKEEEFIDYLINNFMISDNNDIKKCMTFNLNYNDTLMNKTPYILNLTKNNKITLPLFGYVDYKQ